MELREEIIEIIKGKAADIKHVEASSLSESTDLFNELGLKSTESIDELGTQVRSSFFFNRREYGTSDG